jgi:hypothetical protein
MSLGHDFVKRFTRQIDVGTRSPRPPAPDAGATTRRAEHAQRPHNGVLRWLSRAITGPAAECLDRSGVGEGGQAGSPGRFQAVVVGEAAVEFEDDHAVDEGEGGSGAFGAADRPDECGGGPVFHLRREPFAR